MTKTIPLEEDTIVITDRSDAGRILCSPRRRLGFAYAISIGSPIERPPAGLANISRRLRLIFEDELVEGRDGPTYEDIEHLIRFSRTVDLTTGRALIHCQAGISRSPAAAIILLAVLFGLDQVADLVFHVRKIRPITEPNVLMLALADSILETNGALLSAVKLSIPRQPHHLGT